MSIRVRINNTEYTDFLSVNVRLSIENLANEFSFAATSSGDFPPIKKGDLVEIIVDGDKVTTGYIESIEGGYTGNTHGITYFGRDKTGDFIDSRVNTLSDLRGLTLLQVIEKLLENIESDTKVFDTVGSLAFGSVFNPDEDIIKVMPGDNCFEIADKFAKKRQVFLTSNEDGDIVITNSNPTPTTSLLQNKLNNNENNILEADWILSDELRFNNYILRGQLDPVGLAPIPSPDIAAALNQVSGVITDDEIRKGRQYVEVLEKHSSQELIKRAKWLKQVRKARGTKYTAVVHGFRNSDGNLWRENQLATIDDDFADISREMLVNAVNFSYSEDGSFSTLGFVEKNAYTLLAKEPKPVGSELDAFKND